MLKVEVYNESNHNSIDLYTLVCNYFKETLDEYVGNKKIAKAFIEQSIKDNHYIYVVIDNNKIVGFVLMYVFNMYGFTKEYLVVDHMYIKPEYRNSKAILLLYATVGKVMRDLDIEAIGTTYKDSSNINNNNIVGGEVIAYVTKFKFNKLKYKKYLKRI